MKNSVLAIILCLLLVGLIILYYNFNPSSSDSFFPSCPTYTIFGLYCPGCGTQRTIHYLLHGEVLKALRYNPLFVILLPLSILLIIHYLIPKFTDRYWDFKLIRNNAFLYFLFVIITLYFILRNIPIEPFDFLRPPNQAL
ncbi:DUF2752 domain-containing protein [Flavobacteriaceae bacterium Ap0902]|nr:DUF2752 domain-containing protein [Flavobacteriaceae bacterium Ap0902]